VGDGRVEDDWDVYPCLVDDNPASIFLNLRYEREAPLAGVGTLYWIHIALQDAGEHGMGTADEAGELYPLEEAVVDGAEPAGFVFVGRLRNAGYWQMTFYGPAEREDVLRDLARPAADTGRDVEVGSTADPEWGYYADFLLPDPERRQWIQNRRLVDYLEEQGDPLSTPRRVDHWAYFETAEMRDAFLADAAGEGFVADGGQEDGDAPPFAAHVFRTDSVDLDTIHDVVMYLVGVAEGRGGDYDGWETSVESASR
jgi:hypothetical protein